MASIHVKVKKNGEKIYYVVYRRNGKQIWEHVGPSFKDAKRRNARIENGLFTNSLPGPDKTTLGDTVKMWKEEHVKHLSLKTQRGYESYLRNYILPRFDKAKLSMISIDACQAFKRDLMETELSERSIKHIFAIMKSLFNWAITRGIVSRNPVIGIELPRIPKRIVRVLSLQEMQLLIDCSEGVYKGVIAMACYTGMRASEISGLLWRDIDLGEMLIRVERSYDIKGGHLPTKTNSSRRSIPIIKPLYDILLVHSEDNPRKLDEPVFKGKDGKPLVYYHGAFKRALKKAGLPNITFHDLRHSFLSALDSMGVRLTLIKEIAGHSSISVTADIYNHQTIKDMNDLRLMIDKDLEDS